MGLDQFLMCKKSVTIDDIEPLWRRYPPCEISYIILIWRKANAIHRWFVENVQEGNDDCGLYEVSVEELRTLKERCDEVLSKKDENVSRALLPTQSGFFFGSTDYDDYYYETLKYTSDGLSKLFKNLEKHNNGIISFYYQSSW